MVDRLSHHAPRLAGLLVTALLGLLSVGTLGCGGGGGIRWNFDYNQAQRQGRQSNEPILLYFWDWLSIDRSRMDSEVWPDARVIAEARGVVIVPIEQGWFPDLVRQHRVEITPTLILLSSEGEEIARLAGLPTADQLADWLRTHLAHPPATQPSATQPATQPATTLPA